jgi:alkanesulfonate monooxygenase SsuD/methylene tetrahydromethanopterin reductase-like flavin-dependent oxidoreductase (luciferase family)
LRFAEIDVEGGIKVRFGIFYEQQLPKPWGEQDEARLFAEALEQVELADRLGFDVVWTAEHHFLPEYSHSSAPELFLAASTQRTSRIRLGHGIVQATTNHPARIAERIATLDILSKGRVEFGLGEGQGLMELEPFGVTHDDKRARFEDTVRAAVPMLYNDTWSYNGPFISFPKRSVVPRPVQRPHPPLWVACTRTETIRDAGRWGLGVLGFAFASPERAMTWVGAYYNEFLKRQRPLADYVPNPNIAVASYFMCASTDEVAHERAEGCTFFEFSLGQYSRKLLTQPGLSLWDRYQEWRETDAAKQRDPSKLGLIGSPERIRRRLRKMQETHIDQVILLVQTGKTRHEDACESLDIFAREVMPEFHDKDTHHQQWKQSVLAGDIELVDPPEEDLAVDAQRIPGPVQPSFKRVIDSESERATPNGRAVVQNKNS